MSLAAFPTLKGCDLAVTRAPLWPVKILTSAGGTEQRAIYQSAVRYRYTVKVNFVSQTTPGSDGGDAKTLLDFIAGLHGSWDAFTFTDPYDSVSRTCRFDMDEFELTRILSGFWGELTLRIVSLLGSA